MQQKLLQNAAFTQVSALTPHCPTSLHLIDHASIPGSRLLLAGKLSSTLQVSHLRFSLVSSAKARQVATTMSRSSPKAATFPL